MPLGHAGMLDVLQKLTGTRLIAHLAASDDLSPSDVRVPMLTVAGVLGQPEIGETSVSLTLGDPEGEGGGRLRLPSGGLRLATLSTFDGNDFFIIRLAWGDVSVLLQDEASGVV